MNIDDERILFESNLPEHLRGKVRRYLDRYIGTEANNLWDMWKAARFIAPPSTLTKKFNKLTDGDLVRIVARTPILEHDSLRALVIRRARAVVNEIIEMITEGEQS